jgi:hypothetical protein
MIEKKSFIGGKWDLEAKSVDFIEIDSETWRSLFESTSYTSA